MAKRKYFLVFLSVILVNANEFNYKEQERWYDRYEECSMDRQSPIELNSEDAVIRTDMPRLSFELYDIPYTLPAVCENNGLTINIQLPKPKCQSEILWQIYDKLLPRLTGGPLPPTETYIADSVHFHWGSRNTHGSEHVIDSRRYAMEMHIVHRNSKYSSLEQARDYENGLAVIAVLFSVQATAFEEERMDFLGLDSILSALEHVAKYNESAEIENFTLSALLAGLDTSEFFTYAGSLTTPPCSQSVTWLVLAQTIKITAQQMQRFRDISDDSDAILENNNRSLQPKGNRKVFKRQVLHEMADKIVGEGLIPPSVKVDRN